MSVWIELWLVLVLLYALESFSRAKPGEAWLSGRDGACQARPGPYTPLTLFPCGFTLAFKPGGSLDLEAARARWAALSRALWPLRTLCWILFLSLYLVMPALFLNVERVPEWFLGGLAFCALCWWLIPPALAFASRCFSPGSPLPWGPMAHALIAPGFALRSSEALSRAWMDGLHPLAAAKLLMDPDDFHALARRVLLEARYQEQREPGLPMAWMAPVPALEAWLETQNLDLAALTTPPNPTQTDSKTYCPRCLSDFRLEHGTCGDCGIPLRPYL